MQTLAFGAALQRIVTKLGLAELRDFLFPIITSVNSLSPVQKNEFDRLIFKYQHGVELLTGEEALLIEPLGMERIGGPGQLGNLIAQFRGASVNETVSAIPDFWRLYLVLDTMLRMNEVIQAGLVQSKLAPSADDTAILVLSVVDYENDGVTTDRLERILHSAQSLYVTTTQFLDINAGVLRIAFLDSGSDLKIGFEGVDKAIDSISRMFALAWKTIRYRSNEDFARNIESALKGIDLLATIQRETNAGVLDTETAQKLDLATKRSILELIGAGASADEVVEAEIFDRRAALVAARDVKLLGPGESQNDKPAPADA
jgi:hypothetical protein